METKINFSELKTINNYCADEVISALQKEIRRCNFEDATFWGLELLESGDNYITKFWERIIVISVEDVAEHNVVPIVSSLRDNFFELKEAKKVDKIILGIKAIKVLCDAKKDRIVNEIYDYLRFKRKDGLRKEIPEYAIDKHTKKGKEKNLGYEHFLNIASKINNVVENKDNKYLIELLKYSKKGLSPSTYKKQN